MAREGFAEVFVGHEKNVCYRTGAGLSLWLGGLGQGLTTGCYSKVDGGSAERTQIITMHRQHPRDGDGFLLLAHAAFGGTDSPGGTWLGRVRCST